MTSRIRALNEQLFQDVQQNKKVTTRKILTDLTKLRRELRKCINKNIIFYDRPSHPISKIRHHAGIQCTLDKSSASL